MRTFGIVLSMLCWAWVAFGPRAALGAGYREAPFISEHPKVDGSDFYFFRSYQPGRGNFVTAVANYQPFQDAYSGPSYFFMDPNALYEIHVDNNGDCKEDLTFQFRFKNQLKNLTMNIGGKEISSPWLNLGPVTVIDESKLNLEESFTLRVIRGDRRGGTGGDISDAGTGSSMFRKPLDYVGFKSLGIGTTYRDYSNNFVYNINIPGCPIIGRAFAGQRHERADMYVGAIYDLLNSSNSLVGPASGGISQNRGKNVTTLALELPIACLLATDSSSLPSSGTVLGAWTTASLRQGRLLNPSPTFDQPAREGGAWTQVSRVGMPLTNDLFIGFKDKDAYNASKPINDAAFLDYITHPVLPALIEQQFGYAAPAVPRNDLLQAFLTGLPGLNENGSSCEMLRLNTSITPTLRGAQNNLGALNCFDPGPTFNASKQGCDPAGFPNGRRPGDDVVDVGLRLAVGALLPSGQAPNGSLPLSDGATVNDGFILPGFPYMPTPAHGAP